LPFVPGVFLYCFFYANYSVIGTLLLVPFLNIFVTTIPPSTRAVPSPNLQEKLSFRMRSERITANTGVK